MLCPNCRYDNFEGEDSCVECGADLSLSDTPQALADYHDTILGDHLEALGIGSPTLVESGHAGRGRHPADARDRRRLPPGLRRRSAWSGSSRTAMRR